MKTAIAEKISRAAIFHLRQASGGGGGADIVLLDMLRFINKKNFYCYAAYLVGKNKNIEPLAQAFKNHDIELIQYHGFSIFDIRQFLSINDFIRNNNIDIIHCHDSKSRVFAFLIRLINPKLKLVSTLHGWIPIRTRSRIYIFIDKKIIKFFDINIAVSKEIQIDAVKSGSKNTILIYNGVDTDLWNPSDKKNIYNNKLIVGFVGRISKEKGIYEFIHIAKKISKQISNCIFIIAGDGPELNNIKILANHLGIENKIKFLGLKNRSELKEIYNNINLLLIPSHYEGVPLAMLEAMSMEVPLVATKVGGMAEVLDGNEGGILVELNDIDEMVKHAVCLLRNKNSSLALGKKARSIVTDKYSLSDRIASIEKIYIDLIS